MIYFIDEDTMENEHFVIELEERGYEVKIIENADDGLKELKKAKVNEVEAVILDVMLATDEKEKSSFGARETGNFVTTGLVLLDRISNIWREKKMKHLIKRVILISAAQEEQLIRDILGKANEYKISFLKKIDYSNSIDFADDIERVIKKQGK